MQEVARCATRIVILGRGRVIASGTGRRAAARAPGSTSLEDAFVSLLGSGEGLAA